MTLSLKAENCGFEVRLSDLIASESYFVSKYANRDSDSRFFAHIPHIGCTVHVV